MLTWRRGAWRGKDGERGNTSLVSCLPLCCYLSALIYLRCSLHLILPRPPSILLTPSLPLSSVFSPSISSSLSPPFFSFFFALHKSVSEPAGGIALKFHEPLCYPFFLCLSLVVHTADATGPINLTNRHTLPPLKTHQSSLCLSPSASVALASVYGANGTVWRPIAVQHTRTYPYGNIGAPLLNDERRLTSPAP